MTRALILMSLFALSACAEGVQMPASGMSAEGRFLTAVENNGCILNQANTARVLQEADLTTAQVTDIVTKLAAEGKVETSMGASLRITSDRCS
ncbi:hypothetical protein [Yoonia sp.]|uniref:hypothetical protein n=1 Tax=Yoonia sp. TaxID=2212373 RepID=UPI003F6B94A1